MASAIQGGIKEFSFRLSKTKVSAVYRAGGGKRALSATPGLWFLELGYTEGSWTPEIFFEHAMDLPDCLGFYA